MHLENIIHRVHGTVVSAEQAPPLVFLESSYCTTTSMTSLYSLSLSKVLIALTAEGHLPISQKMVFECK